MSGFFRNVFGKCEKQNFPFDKEKAYCFLRQGVIAGGGFSLKLDPEGIVEHYSYVNPVPENECGMRDRGAYIYFSGLNEGNVEVTAVYHYPTCEDEVEIFTLKVDRDLCVRRIN